MMAQWQAAMIRLARSARIKNFMQQSRAGSVLARRYVAGPTPEDAARFSLDLQRRGIRQSTFYLGEYVDTTELVAENVGQKLAAIRALGEAGREVHVSADPTQIGFQQSASLALANAARIAEAIAEQPSASGDRNCLMLDMEDASVVDATIAMHDALRRRSLPVALTVQAYLRRTEHDLECLIAAGAHVRLVKGAFALRGGQGFASHAEIKRNYYRLVERMLSRRARDSGFYPSIATHDVAIHDFAIATARKNGWAAGDFEFEMLLGVRPAAAHRLAELGQCVRLYVPFGVDWWPHAARRIGESPRNAVLLARSLIG